MKEKITRYTIAILLLLVAINALGGGYYGLTGAKDIPLEWLKDSPFKNYLLPSLFLFVVIGGSCLIAAIAVFRRRGWAGKAAFICSIILFAWLAAQVVIIGYVSALQPATAVAATLILLLSLLYPKQQRKSNIP